MQQRTVSVLAYTCSAIGSALRCESGRTGPIARAFAGLVLAVAILLASSHPAAAATYVYTYTGNQFGGGGSYTSPYASTNFVSVTLTLPSQLLSNFSGSVYAAISSQAFTFSMSDGVQTLSAAVDSSGICHANAPATDCYARIATQSGNIISWQVEIYAVEGVDIYSVNDPGTHICDGPCSPDDYATNGSGFADITTPGTWSTYSYLYTGNHFTTFKCATSPSQDCSTPGNGNPYTTSNFVTAALKLANPLSISNGAVQNVSSYPGFQLTMSDGQQSVTENAGSCNFNCSAFVVVDTGGNIVAWYLQVPTGEGPTIYSLYDPSSSQHSNGAIYEFCGGECYSRTNLNANGSVDYGSGYFGDAGFQYAYNTGIPGAVGAGGTVQLGGCINTGTLNCDAGVGAPFEIAGPNAAAAAGFSESEQLCIVPADPRGPNCGAGANNNGFPRQLAVKDIPQCKGFGNEVIPEYLCGASGPSGTGFALIRGVAEELDSLNGIYVPSKNFIGLFPALTPAPTCLRPLQGGTSGPYSVSIGGTRTDSSVEEQTPERTLDGRPLLTEVTAGCDPDTGTRPAGYPGSSIMGYGFRNRIDDNVTRLGLTRVQRMVLYANYKYINLDVILALTKFPPSPDTTKTKLQTCVNKSQQLLNSGNYMCAAEQIYRCETNFVDPVPYMSFGPSSSPLRLPDPYGDIVRRLGNLFYTVNNIGITAGVPAMVSLGANINWEPMISWASPAVSDPYSTSCP